MKVLLVTIIDNCNLGNRLQHYALQTILSNLNLDVSSAMYNQVKMHENLFKMVAKSFVYRLGVKKYYSGSLIEFKDGNKRQKMFKEFSSRYISNQIETDFFKAFSQDFSSFDYAVTGSDQVWHNWKEQHGLYKGKKDNDLKYFYLEFMPPNKRISFAPSFGFSVFPQEDINVHINGISNMKALSCREYIGCNLIKNITGRTAEHVLDPTLLLGRSQWELISERPKYSLPNRYMVLYFLGNIDQTYKNKIYEVSNRFDLEIININDPLNYKKYYFSSPANFIYVISHSNFVCTDSFHATVFSIIFEKNFISFQRKQEGFEKMFGRIEDLLSNTKLNDHVFNKNVIPNDNISGAYDRLNELRCKSIDYLKRALQLND